MRVFTDLNLNGRAPVRAQADRGIWGPRGVPSTRMKKAQRIIVPIVVTGIAVALFFLGRMFFLIMSGGAQ